MPATSEGDSALLNGNFDLVAGLAATGSSNFHRHVAETDQAFGSFEPDDGAIPCSSMEAFDLFAAPFDDAVPESSNNPLQLRVITDINEQFTDPDAKEVEDKIHEAEESVNQLFYMVPFLEQRLFHNPEMESYVTSPMFLRYDRSLDSLEEYADENLELPEITQSPLLPYPVTEHKTVKSVLDKILPEPVQPPVDRLAAIFRHVHSIHKNIVKSAKTTEFKLSKNSIVKNVFEASIAYYLFQHEKEASDIGCLIHESNFIDTINVLRCYCDPHVKMGRKILIVVPTEKDLLALNLKYPDCIPLLDADDLLNVDDKPDAYIIPFADFVRVMPDCKDFFHATILYQIPLEGEACQELENIPNEHIPKLGKIIMFVQQYKEELAVLMAVVKFILRSILVAPKVFSGGNKIDATIEAYVSRFTGSTESTNRAVVQFFNQLSFHPRVRRRVVPNVVYHVPQKATEAIFLARMSQVLYFLKDCLAMKRRVTILVELESEKFAVKEHLENKGIQHDSPYSIKYSVDRHHQVVGVDLWDLKSPINADEVIVFNVFSPDVAKSIISHLVMNEGVFDIRVTFVHSEIDPVYTPHFQEAFNDYSSTPPLCHDYRNPVPQYFTDWQRLVAPKFQRRIQSKEMIVFPLDALAPAKLTGRRKHETSVQYKEIRQLAATMAPPMETITIEEEEEEAAQTPATPAGTDAPSKPLSKRAQQRARANARRLAEVAPIKPPDPSVLVAAAAAAAAAASDAAPQSPPPATKGQQPPSDQAPSTAIPPQLSRKNLERLSTERIRIRLPAFFRGFHHGAPFGPPADASLMRRTSTPTPAVHPLVVYYISKLMIKYSLFGNYYRMLYTEDKYYKTTSSYFSWDAAHQHLNRVFHPFARQVHRNVLNKQFFVRYFKKTIISFTMDEDNRFISHDRQFHRELVDYCKDAIVPYTFDADLDKRAVSDELEELPELSIEEIQKEVTAMDRQFGIEYSKPFDDCVLFDVLAHRRKPDEPERTFFPIESMTLLLKYPDPLVYVKVASRSELGVSANTDSFDDDANEIESYFDEKLVEEKEKEKEEEKVVEKGKEADPIKAEAKSPVPPPTNDVPKDTPAAPADPPVATADQTATSKDKPAVPLDPKAASEPPLSTSARPASLTPVKDETMDDMTIIPADLIDDEWLADFQDSNDGTNMSPLLQNADFEYNKTTIFIPPEPITSEVQSPMSLPSNEAAKDMPSSDKPLDDDLTNDVTMAEEDLFPVEETIEYSNLDTIGPYRKRAKRRFDNDLSSKWISARGFYELDVVPPVNKFTDIMANLEERPPTLNWLHSARTDIGNNIPAGREDIDHRKRKPTKPLPVVIPPKIDRPEVVVPVPVTVEKPAEPVVPVPAVVEKPSPPIPVPAKVVDKREPSVTPVPPSFPKATIKILKPKHSFQMSSSASNLRTSPKPPPATTPSTPRKEPSPEIVCVGETKVPPRLANTTPPAKAGTKRANSQPVSMYIIPKRRKKIPQTVKIDRVIRYHPPGTDKRFLCFEELPPVDDSNRFKLNFELPQVRVFMQATDVARKVGTYLELLNNCPKLRKIVIGRLELMMKEMYKTPSEVEEHNKTSRHKVTFKAIVPRNIPKTMKDDAGQSPMCSFWVRDYLHKNYLSRANYNQKPPRNGVRFGDTSVATVAVPKYKVLKNMLNSWPMRGLNNSELMVVASAERAFQTNQLVLSAAQQARSHPPQPAPSAYSASVRIITPRAGHVGMRPMRPPQQPAPPRIQLVPGPGPMRPQRMPTRNPMLPTSMPGSFIAKRLGTNFHSPDFHTKHCGCAKPMSYPVFQHEASIKFKKELFTEIRSMLDKKLIVADNKAHLFGRFAPAVIDIVKNDTAKAQNLMSTVPSKSADGAKVTFDEAIVAATKQYKQRRRFVRKLLRKRRKFCLLSLFKKKAKPRPKSVETPYPGGIGWSLRSFREVSMHRIRTRCRNRQQTLMVMRGLAPAETRLWLRQYAFRYNLKGLDINRQPQRRMTPWQLKQIMIRCRSMQRPKALRTTPGIGKHSFKETVNHPTRRFDTRRPRSNSFCGARASRKIVLHSNVDDIRVHLTYPPKRQFGDTATLEGLKKRLWKMYGTKSVVDTLPAPILFDPKKINSNKAAPTTKQEPVKERKPWDLNMATIDRSYFNIDRTRGPSHFMNRTHRSPKLLLNKYIRYRHKYPANGDLWKSFYTPYGTRSVTDVYNHDLV